MKLDALLLSTAAPILAFAAFSAPAHASTYYGVVRAGVGEGEVSAFGGSLDSDQGLAIGGGAGIAFDNGLRFEVGIDKLNADLGPGGFVAGEAYAYSGGVALDFNPHGKLKPFIGAGVSHMEGEANLGFASLEGSGDGAYYDVGVTADVAGPWSVELRRRAMDGTLEMDGGFGDVDLATTSWTLGLRRAF